jgi:hypothetical protein
MDKLQDYLSRKFILTILVLGMVGIGPITYKENGVSDTVTLTVLVILASVGVAYGFINIKDAKSQLQENAKDIAANVNLETEAKP